MRLLLILVALIATPALAQSVQKPPTQEAMQAVIQTLQAQRNAALDQQLALAAALADAQKQIADLKAQAAKSTQH